MCLEDIWRRIKTCLAVAATKLYSVCPAPLAFLAGGAFLIGFFNHFIKVHRKPRSQCMIRAQLDELGIPWIYPWGVVNAVPKGCKALVHQCAESLWCSWWQAAGCDSMLSQQSGHLQLSLKILTFGGLQQRKHR